LCLIPFIERIFMAAYQERWYRNFPQTLSFRCEVTFQETDLLISSDLPLSQEKVKDLIEKYYNQISDYCLKYPEFSRSLSPLSEDPAAPLIVQDMLQASRQSNIGPFSAVAGAMAQYVGSDLLSSSSQLMVENGGDLFLALSKETVLGLYLGPDFFPDILKVRIKAQPKPFGICSSSGKIGHSISLGRADLVTVKADSAILADTFATALANKLKTKQDIKKIIDQARTFPFIQGLICACDGSLGIWGDFQIAE